MNGRASAFRVITHRSLPSTMLPYRSVLPGRCTKSMELNPVCPYQTVLTLRLPLAGFRIKFLTGLPLGEKYCISSKRSNGPNPLRSNKADFPGGDPGRGLMTPTLELGGWAVDFKGISCRTRAARDKESQRVIFIIRRQLDLTQLGVLVTVEAQMHQSQVTVK